MRRLKPSLIASPAVQQVLTKEDVDWVGGSFDSPISIWIGEPVVDLAEHKVWEDEGCSSHPPSVGDISDGDAVLTPLVHSLLDMGGDSSEEPTDLSSNDESPTRDQVMALMNLKSSDVQIASK